MLFTFIFVVFPLIFIIYISSPGCTLYMLLYFEKEINRVGNWTGV